MFSRKDYLGAAGALLAMLGAGAAHAVTQAPKGDDFGLAALRVHDAIPGPSRDALFIARAIEGPERGGRAKGAEAPLPGFARDGRGRAWDRPKGGHEADGKADHGETRGRGDHHGRPDPVGMTLPAVVAGAAPVPVPAAAPLLFAALGGLALLGRRTRGQTREKGASEA